MTRQVLPVIIVAFSLGPREASAQKDDGDIAGATKLIEDAQAKYQRLPVGNVPKYLYEAHRTDYGWKTPEFIGLCARLVARSLAKAASKKALADEFHRIIRTYDPGLLLTYGEIGLKWKVPERFSAKIIDETIRDSADRRLFRTALLAESFSSVWFFVVGYEYYKR